MRKFTTKKLVLAALFMALGLILPFFVGQIPAIGSMLLPMHLPILLAGFVCGWPLGLLVGLITPLLRSVMFGMPPLFPTALTLAFELATYGCLAGLFYKLLPKKAVYLYGALILAMVGGRVVWGLANFVILGLVAKTFTWPLFVAGAFTNALPGIIVQLVIIPPILIALRKARLFGYDA
jgi:thiamine transporter ThiT